MTASAPSSVSRTRPRTPSSWGVTGAPCEVDLDVCVVDGATERVDGTGALELVVGALDDDFVADGLVRA